jgi:hypothetical protein
MAVYRTSQRYPCHDHLGYHRTSIRRSKFSVACPLLKVNTKTKGEGNFPS